jgi:transposase
MATARCWRRGVGRGRVESRVARRARIVSLAAEGCSNRDIGVLVDLHYNQVGVWRQRYAEFGLAGLDDQERSGRPRVYDHDDVLLLVSNLASWGYSEPVTSHLRWPPWRGQVGGRVDERHVGEGLREVAEHTT